MAGSGSPVILIDVRFVPTSAVQDALRTLEIAARDACAGAGQCRSWHGYKAVGAAGSNRDFVSRSDALAILTYARWSSRSFLEAFLASTVWTAFAGKGDPGPWAGRAFSVAFAEPAARWRDLDLEGADGRVAHTGLFAVRTGADVDAFLKTAHESARIAVEGTPGLIAAAFHRSLDGERVVNFGLWRSAEVFATFAKAPPFEDGYWEPYARNEGYAYERCFSVAGHGAAHQILEGAEVAPQQ